MYFQDYYNRREILRIMTKVRHNLHYARNAAIRLARWIFEGGIYPRSVSLEEESFLLRHNYFVPFFDFSANGTHNINTVGLPIVVPMMKGARDELGDLASSMYRLERIDPTQGEEFRIREERSQFWSDPKNFNHLSELEKREVNFDFARKLEKVPKRSKEELDAAVKKRTEEFKNRQILRREYVKKLEDQEIDLIYKIREFEKFNDVDSIEIYSTVLMKVRQEILNYVEDDNID